MACIHALMVKFSECFTNVGMIRSNRKASGCELKAATWCPSARTAKLAFHYKLATTFFLTNEVVPHWASRQTSGANEVVPRQFPANFRDEWICATSIQKFGLNSPYKLFFSHIFLRWQFFIHVLCRKLVWGYFVIHWNWYLFVSILFTKG